MNYVFTHENKSFTPEGRAPISDPEVHNRELESQEIEHLKTHPEKVMLYARLDSHKNPACTSGSIQTWLGTQLAHAWFSERKYMGYGHNTYRRAVTCKLFGVAYHGWYMESSGDYVRLKKAKRQ